jgi:transposase InsO family protein
MNGHRNAKLGLAGRHALVLAIESGMTLKAAAAAFNVAPATAHRWWHRWLEAAPAQRRTLACLSERSSRPHRSPRMLCAKAQERICEVREHTGWGPRLIAGVTGHPHSTVHKVLRRHGCSRVPRPPRGEICRYEWDCPGDLLHMDTKRYARFERPGHAATGVRDKTGAEKRRGVGYEFAHSIVDDHSRLAYSELHPDERAETVSGFVRRALDFFDGHGITTKRLMTDNAWCYTHSHSLRELLARRQVKHVLIAPHRPQTNGKVERFQQTMAREWAYGLVYRSSDDRRRALPHWVAYYNERRPHSGIGDRPPLSRVHNVCG